MFAEICEELASLCGQSDFLELGALVAVLRTAAIVHQSHHWQTSGPSYYGDHLLFERLYNDSQPFIDQVAERTIGSGGNPDLLCPKVQTALMDKITDQCPTVSTSSEMVGCSLEVERCVLNCVNDARETLENKGQLSNGTDNLLQGVADKHEEFIYLLQQRQQNIKMASYTYKRN